MKILLTVLLLIGSCVGNKPHVNIVEINTPILEEIYYDFIEEANKRGVTVEYDFIFSLIVDFKMDVFTFGFCEKGFGGEIRTVRINGKLPANFPRLEEIVFHELGHCILDRPHLDTMTDSGEYVSIMKTVGLVKDYDGRREELLDELFSEL